jgi:hypothetical protein
MATGALAPAFWFTALDDDGAIAPGALLNFFLSGTSTPATVYHDANLGTPWTQPAVADTAGRIVVYLDPAVGNLKLIATDSLGVPLGPTVDPVTPTNAGVASGVGTAAFVFGSNSSAAIADLAYPAGATFDKLVPGTAVWLVDPATLSGTYKLEITAMQVVSGTLSVALVNLDGGSPDTPLAIATATSLTGEVSRSGAITFPSGGSSIHFGLKAKVSANEGFLIGAEIIRTA